MRDSNLFSNDVILRDCSNNYTFENNLAYVTDISTEEGSQTICLNSNEKYITQLITPIELTKLENTFNLLQNCASAPKMINITYVYGDKHDDSEIGPFLFPGQDENNTVTFNVKCLDRYNNIISDLPGVSLLMNFTSTNSLSSHYVQIIDSTNSLTTCNGMETVRVTQAQYDESIHFDFYGTNMAITTQSVKLVFCVLWFVFCVTLVFC